MFLTDKTKLDGTPSKIKWKIYTCLLAHCILSFKVFLIEECKIKLVCQFLYFLLFYIASEFTSADIIFNIHWFNGFTQTHTPLLLSVTKVFRLCSLNLENFWFYIWVVVLWLNFTTQMTLRHLLLMFMNKILDCKDHEIYSKMLRKICM